MTCTRGGSGWHPTPPGKRPRPGSGGSSTSTCIGQYLLYGDRLFPGVENYARQVLEVAVRKDAKRPGAFPWCLLGEALVLQARWDESAACLERSRRLYGELGVRSGALPWQRLAEVSACLGHSSAAQDFLQRAMAIAGIADGAPHVGPHLRHGRV